MDIQTQIKEIIDNNHVVLFMKGSAQQPTCGFSATAARLLGDLNVEFFSIDVMGVPGMREAIKVFSNWPTLPQLYIDKQFIGGCDIMQDMHRSGKLQELVAAYQKCSD